MGEREPEYVPTPTIGPLDALAAIRATARQFWYTIAVHGSLSRDIDLIAVPWEQVAGCTPAELVAACAESLGVPCLVDGPEQRHHRRLAWSIRVPRHSWYIDLSVITPEVTVHDYEKSPASSPVGGDDSKELTRAEYERAGKMTAEQAEKIMSRLPTHD